MSNIESNSFINESAALGQRSLVNEPADDWQLVDEPESDWKVVNTNEETFQLESTGEVVKAPEGTLAAIQRIASGGFDVGRAGVEKSQLVFRKLLGDDDPEIDKKIKELNKRVEASPETEGLPQEMLRASSTQIPVLIDIAEKASISSIALSGAMIAGGAVIGGVAGIPAGPVGIGAGVKLGSVSGARLAASKLGPTLGLGAATSIFIMESADIYDELLNTKDDLGNTVHPTAARTAAVLGGAAATGFQMMPITVMAKLVPGSDRVFKNLGAKATDVIKVPTGGDAIKNFGLNISKIMGAELLAETGAETVKIAAVEAGKEISSMIFDQGKFDNITGSEIIDRILEVQIETAKAVPLIGASVSTPKLVVDVMDARKAARETKQSGERIEETYESPEVQQVVDDANRSLEEADAEITLIQEQLSEALPEQVEELKRREAEAKTKKSDAIKFLDSKLDYIIKTNKTLATSLMAERAKTRLDKIEADIAKIDTSAVRDLQVPFSRVFYDGKVPEDVTPETIKDLKEVSKRMPKRPQTLMGYLQSLGGIQESAGELKHMGITNKTRPGFVNSKGLALDEAAMRAWEEGFFPEFPTRPEIKDLLDAIRDEYSGFRISLREKDQGYFESLEQFALANEALNQMGIDMEAFAKYAKIQQARLGGEGRKGGKLRKAERVMDKVRRQVNKAFKEGARQAGKDIKAAQAAVIKVINESGILPADKGKFINDIKNIQTLEQYNKQMPKIKRKIIKILENAERKRLKDLIIGAINNTKTIMASGRVTGKYTPETQKIFDNLRKLAKLKKDKAASMLADRVAKYVMGDMAPSFEARLENMVLGIVSGQTTDIKMLETFANDILSVISEAKDIRKAMASGMEKTLNEDIATVIDLVGDGPTGNESWVRATINEAGKTVGRGFNNWAGTFALKLKTLFGSRDGDRVNAFLEKISQFDENLAFEIGKSDMITKVSKLMIERTGLTERKLMKKLYKDSSKKIKLGSFLFSDGKTKSLEMTVAEMRKRMMELADPTLREAIYHKEGNGYTDAIVEAIREQLTETDMQIVNAQLEFYKGYYERINEVYKKLNNVDLGKVEFYSPIRRITEDGEGFSEFLSGIMYRGGVTPGSLKSRVPNIAPLKNVGDFEVLISHTYAMEYYIAFAEKTIAINRIFKNNEVVKAIVDKVGTKGYDSIKRDVDFFMNKGQVYSGVVSKTMITLVRNFGFAQLAAKPQIGLKQLTSFPAFIQDVSVKDFMVGIAAFAANPTKAYRTLQKSEWYKRRGVAIDRDFQAMIQDKSALNVLGRKPSLTKALMIFIRLGDKGAILIGGYAHYHAQVKAGKTEAEALRSFENIANKTQQSAYTDQLSEMQRSNSFLEKLLTQFMSSPNALARAEYEAIVDGLRGRISKKEMAKRLFVYHVLIPNFFMMAANGFEWKEEDQLKASILGMANGIFLLGSVIDAIVSKMVTGSYYSPSIRNPLEFVETFLDVLSKPEEITLEDFWEGSRTVDMAMQATGEVTGIPLATFYRQFLGLKMIDDDPEYGTYLMLGYSPYVIDNKILD